VYAVEKITKRGGEEKEKKISKNGKDPMVERVWTKEENMSKKKGVVETKIIGEKRAEKGRLYVELYGG